MAYSGIQHINGLDKTTQNGDGVPSWWRDMRTAWAGAASLLAIAIGLWHFGGSTLFTYDRRLAVIEAQNGPETKIEDTRKQLDLKIEGVRDGFEHRFGRIEDTVNRVEAKVDIAAANSAESFQKINMALARMEHLRDKTGDTKGRKQTTAVSASPAQD